MRLNQGELLQHYRYRQDGPACGIRSGCVTGVLADVGCEDCRTVVQRATELAEACGCRIAAVHASCALAQIEIEAERRT